MPLRLSWQLRLVPFWPALPALAVAGLLLWLRAPGILEETAAAQLDSALAVLSPLAGPHLREDPASLQAWVAEISGPTTLRITVISSDGSVLADSSRTPEELREMDDHSAREEVREAFARGGGSAVRRSATTGRDYVYAARTLTDPAGHLVVLRLAQPLSQLRAFRLELARTLLLAALLTLAGVAATAWWLDRQLVRPLSRLLDDSRPLTEGSFGHRVAVPEAELPAVLAGCVNRVAQRCQEALETLATETSHLRAVLTGFPEGVLVVDGEGRVAWTNPAFRRLFGSPDDGGSPGHLELARHPQLESLVAETLERRQGRRVELELGGPTGRIVSVAASPLASSSGAVVLARDTTDLVRAQRVRRDFVANVSHELKTPLAAIRGYAETLEDPALTDPEATRRFLRRILEQSRRLEALLADLLTLSRLESPEAVGRRQEVDLAQLGRRVLDLVEEHAAGRGIAVELETAGPLPRLVGEPEALERLLANLVDNAIKYNRPGGRVTVRLRPEEEGVLLEVRDTGIGIPPQDLDRIFERFYRVDRSRSRQEGGTGLGLAIVKHAALLHGGRVEVESTPGTGSTFRVHLPIRKAPPQA